MRNGLDIKNVGARAWRRMRSAASPVALAALAAALAWLIAHRILGHTQPFFAPIAAAIALSSSRVQRSRRIVQMVAGVLIGIGIAELLMPPLGTTTVALGVIVFLTMSVALMTAAGFVGEGMMFVNQAAASAILVVTLHRHGAGSERAVDALVGGGVALCLGVLMFPAEPLALLWTAERDVLKSLGKTLQTIIASFQAETLPPGDWVQREGYETHQLLGALARARSTAHANVRVAPRRWRLRERVDAENLRLAQLDLLANAILSLARLAAAEVAAGRMLSKPLQRDVLGLQAAIMALAGAPRPWPDSVAQGVHDACGVAHADVLALAPDSTPVLATFLGAAANDLQRLVRMPAA